MCYLISSIVILSTFVLALAEQKLEASKNEQPKVTMEDLVDNKTLKFVFVVARHGPQFPDSFMIDSNPKYEYKHYKFPRGELNKVGRRDMYDVGDLLTKLYPQFLSRSYVTKHLTKVTAVGSKYTLVTRESALILREGLRGKSRRRALKKRWSARRLATTRNDEFTDAALEYMEKCKHYRKAQNEALLTRMAPKFKTDERFLNLSREIKKNTGIELNYKNLTGLHSLFELYQSSYFSGFKIPKWLDSLLLVFDEAKRRYTAASFSTKYLKKVAGGRMLQYLFDRLDDKLNNRLEPCDTRMMVHVGYDATLMPFLAALGGSQGFLVENKTIKHFGFDPTGMVVVEAHQLDSQNDFWLKVYSMANVVSPIDQLTINDCAPNAPCSFSRLKQLREKIAVTKPEWEKLCEDGPKQRPKDSDKIPGKSLKMTPKEAPEKVEKTTPSIR